MTCFFDISRAYDQVWHAKLLQKLDKIGISGNMYNYIRSFLSDRSMQVRWNGATSTTKGVSMGVPQGKWRTLHNWLYKTSKQHVKKNPINTAHIATIEYYILHVIYHMSGTQVMSASQTMISRPSLM